MATRLLGKWRNNALARDVEKLIIESWKEKSRKQDRAYFDQKKDFCQC